MIRGLLMDDGTKVLHLIFTCPNCGETHGCLVDDVHYHNGFTNVWAYKKSIGDDNIIELYPSFNHETGCGWHSEYNWIVEVMHLQEGQMRNEATKKWLDNK